eukprot:TRINITY_DN28959_c0_g1_i1.p1 TRINITY_DN28959_c0_g1~~TRINITY_DN28959_c0_g1_i1.p1  ORF type:complete len:697 (+),score=43.19 TRINITY_DN28959_c0_g1_i1:315-2405(+)
MEGCSESVNRRFSVLAQHLSPRDVMSLDDQMQIAAAPCLQYIPPERNEAPAQFNPADLYAILSRGAADIHNEMFNLFANNKLFWSNQNPPRGHMYTCMDYNSTKEEQRDVTFQRILFLRDRGYFKGWLTDDTVANLSRKAAMHEAIGMFDHSMATKIGVHIHLWGGALKYLGTQRHHAKWLSRTEDYEVAGCFGLTELGHGSNVRGIETVATYDAAREEFVITTPCETAQKYWIGGAAMHANHTVCFAQLHMNGRNEGVHAFIVPIRDAHGRNMPGVRIADCGHKTCLNGIDNGRMWFDDVRIPRENLLNAVADVTADGRYISPISDPEQRFAAFMAPLTGGRVTIAVSSLNQCKIGLAIALRYALSRRAFSNPQGTNEVLLLDYPTHQRRLLPLLAKTYAMCIASRSMGAQYIQRKASDAKKIHVQSSGYKAMNTWHMMRTLQECREACGGMGVKSDSRIGHLYAEHDVMTTFEGDNVVLMQTVSKALLGDYLSARRKGKALQGLGLEHLNGPRPVVPTSASRAVLRDGDFLVALYRLRVRDLIERLASRVSVLVSSGLSMGEALNQSFQLGSDLGRAHSELEVLMAAKAVEQRVAPGPLKDVLNAMLTLNCLVAVDEDPVFLRYGYITSEQAQAVHDEVVLLCKELRPHALPLVEAFGLPDHILGPIAFDWVDFESWKNVGQDAGAWGAHVANL